MEILRSAFVRHEGQGEVCCCSSQPAAHLFRSCGKMQSGHSLSEAVSRFELGFSSMQSAFDKIAYSRRNTVFIENRACIDPVDG